MLVFKVECQEVFYRNWEANEPEMLPEFSRKPHLPRGHLDMCFDCAGASGPRVGPSRKTEQKRKNDLRTSTHDVEFSTKK